MITAVILSVGKPLNWNDRMARKQGGKEASVVTGLRKGERVYEV